MIHLDSLHSSFNTTRKRFRFPISEKIRSHISDLDLGSEIFVVLLEKFLAATFWLRSAYIIVKKKICKRFNKNSLFELLFNRYCITLRISVI